MKRFLRLLCFLIVVCFSVSMANSVPLAAASDDVRFWLAGARSGAGELEYFTHDSNPSKRQPLVRSGVVPRHAEPVKHYCLEVLRSTRVKVSLLRRPFPRPSDCAAFFKRIKHAQAAEPGQPDRGGDGGGTPNAPGGRGGDSGEAGGGRARLDRIPPGAPFGRGNADPEFLAFCTDLLQSPARRSPQTKFKRTDCADYFLWLDRQASVGESDNSSRQSNGSARRGADGPSIDGGIGGPGGRGGSGPSGGRGGAGGAGVSGGRGGAGGAGGSSD